MKNLTAKNLLSVIASYLPDNPVIIEAGAFNGKDTKKMGSFWPSGTIHAFEPVPTIFNDLVHETAAYTNIFRYRMALSNVTGSQLFYLSQNPKHPDRPCAAGTLHRPTQRLELSPITYPLTTLVPTITLSDWADQTGIKSADFLWLDMQGHELAVLMAAPEFITKALVIYLEVNFIQAYQNQPLFAEINIWMNAHGFGIAGQDFDEKTTHFFGNALYVRR